jgi:hypothetical protein
MCLFVLLTAIAEHVRGCVAIAGGYPLDIGMTLQRAAKDILTVK